MAKLRALPAREIIDGLKGTLDFYVQHGQVLVRRWPRNRHAGFNPNSRIASARFAAVNKAMSACSPNLVLAQRENVMGTHWTWKDHALMGYYGSNALRQYEDPTSQWPWGTYLDPLWQRYWHPIHTKGVHIRGIPIDIRYLVVYTNVPVHLCLHATTDKVGWFPWAKVQRGVTRTCGELAFPSRYGWWEHADGHGVDGIGYYNWWNPYWFPEEWNFKFWVSCPIQKPGVPSVSLSPMWRYSWEHHCEHELWVQHDFNAIHGLIRSLNP